MIFLCEIENKKIYLKELSKVIHVKCNECSEIDFLKEILNYLGEDDELREVEVELDIVNPKKQEGILQLFCINSFKKRKHIKSVININKNSEKFKIKIKNIKEIIKLFNLIDKMNLIDKKKYFFGFLINYYFYLNET